MSVSAHLSAADHSQQAVLTAEPLALLAHELRCPLGAIRNAVGLMESAHKLPGAMDQARRLIARQVGQLSVLVEDLLDLVSLARGTLGLRREWVDLVQEVEAAVESCSWAITRCGHTFCLQVPAAPVRAYVDGARIRQVVTNLLDNACCYTQSFGRIRLTLEQLDGFAVIHTEDNGADIAPEHLPHVFDLSAVSRPGGENSVRSFGVGFALVREIVEQHGGGVEARNAGAGRGSAFVVRLPICASP